MQRPDAAQLLRDARNRLARLERSPGARRLTPVRVDDAVAVNATAFIATHVALANAASAKLTWSVLVGGSATGLTLRVRDSTSGATGPTVSAGGGVVTVSLPTDPDWPVGEERLVYLDARVTTGTATVLALNVVTA